MGCRAASSACPLPAFALLGSASTPPLQMIDDCCSMAGSTLEATPTGPDKTPPSGVGAPRDEEGNLRIHDHGLR